MIRRQHDTVKAARDIHHDTFNTIIQTFFYLDHSSNDKCQTILPFNQQLK